MGVREEIALLPPEQRGAHKASRLAAIAMTLQPAWQRDGVHWRIHEAGLIHNAGLRLMVSCRRGKTVIVPASDPVELWFFNPPIMVPDGTDADGKPQAFREDLAEAVKGMCADKLPQIEAGQR